MSGRQSGLWLDRPSRSTADRAKKLGEKQADNAFAALYRGIVPDEKIEKVNKIFVTRFEEELDVTNDLPTLTGRAYEEALGALLRDEYVQDLLQAPLDGQSELNWEPLRSLWRELRLIELPREFEWSRVAKTYRKALQRLALTNAELRPVLEALSALRTAEASEQTARNTARMAGLARTFDLDRYAAAVRTAFSRLKLGPVTDEWNRYEGLRLESIYIPQSVKQALPPRDLTRDYLRQLREEKREHGLELQEEQLNRLKEQYTALQTRPLEEVIDDPATPRHVILGDPGLGKSTLLKHLALRWAEKRSEPLTIFLELRRASKFESFLDYLERGAEPTCCLPKLELDDYLKANDARVLFDGLDEVLEGPRADTVAKIIAFSNDYPRARIVVTTRIHGYHPGSQHPEQFRDAGFQQFTLQDFSASEIERFIVLWHQEAFREGDERERFESRLRRVIEDSPSIQELAANPLLLTMMAILSRNQDLPRDRGKLYERCAELLLKNWELEKFPELKEKRDARDIKDKLGPDQKMRILELVAAAMQAERTGLAGNLISQAKLRDIIREELMQLGVEQPWSVADDLIWMLSERNFMLADWGDRQYAFVHRTFLEYFCARNIKYRLERTSSFTPADLKALFAEHWRKDAWREVLRLLCGMIGVEYAATCLLELLQARMAEGGHAAIFLAAQCLREVREVHSVFKERNDIQQALTKLAEFHSVDSDFLFGLQKLEGTLGFRVRTQAVQELAHGWKNHPATLPWLTESALKDPNQDVRSTALQELARGWKDNPDILSWLQDSVRHDAHWVVRITALQELARFKEDDPVVARLLMDSALIDDHWAVRSAALQELARGWKEDPAALLFVKDRAHKDDNEYARRTAVEELKILGHPVDAHLS